MKKILFLLISCHLFSMDREISYSKKESTRFIHAVQQFLKLRYHQLAKLHEQRKHEHEKILKHIAKSDINIDDKVFDSKAFHIDIQIKTILTKEGLQQQKTNNIIPNPEFNKKYEMLLGLPKREKHTNDEIGLLQEFIDENSEFFSNDDNHQDKTKLHTMFLKEVAQTYSMGYNASLKDEYKLGFDEEKAKVDRAFNACIPHLKSIFNGVLQRMQYSDGKFCLKFLNTDDTSSSGSAHSTPMHSPRLQEDFNVTRERANSIDHSLAHSLKKKNLVRSRSRSFSGK